VEAGRRVSIESLRAIASALQIDVAELQGADSLPTTELDSKSDQTRAGIAALLEERRLLEEKIDVLCQYWADRAPVWRAFDGDRRKIEKWIHDFGEPNVCVPWITAGGNMSSFGPMVRRLRSPRDMGSP
jgi:hypothetical protein